MPSVPRSEYRLAADDGPHSESPVWLPIENALKLSAVDTPEPPLEPIELFDGSNAFHTWPHALSEKCPEFAYSAIVDLPMMTAPASRMSLTCVASFVGRKPSKTRLPLVVGMSFVS